MSRRVLIVAAHPDDEVVGAGGVMAWHRKAGDRVFALILGEGLSARFPTREAVLSATGLAAFEDLRRDMARAHAVLGAEKTFHHEFPDNRFDSIDLLDIVKVIEQVKTEVSPEVVYTNHGGDLNVDHRLTFEAVLTACRPLPGEPVRRILSFEVASSTEWSPPSRQAFMPNVFVELGDLLAVKLEAMACYKSEVREYPHPRSLEAVRRQAELWGVKAGLKAAEAFVLIRERVQ